MTYLYHYCILYRKTKEESKDWGNGFRESDLIDTVEKYSEFMDSLVREWEAAELCLITLSIMNTGPQCLSESKLPTANSLEVKNYTEDIINSGMNKVEHTVDPQKPQVGDLWLTPANRLITIGESFIKSVNRQPHSWVLVGQLDTSPEGASSTHTVRSVWRQVCSIL